MATESLVREKEREEEKVEARAKGREEKAEEKLSRQLLPQFLICKGFVLTCFVGHLFCTLQVSGCMLIHLLRQNPLLMMMLSYLSLRMCAGMLPDCLFAL